jgi:transcriptional regulator with XRE-family HTH domain
MDEIPQNETRRAASPVDRHVGTQLQLRRLELGLGLPQVSDSLGVSIYEIERWEAGLTRVPARDLLALSRCLSVPLTTLFGGVAA